MRVSVVLPYYENSRTLIACLNSFMRQTHPPDEVIVVDDGSMHPAQIWVDAHTWPVPVHLHVTSHRGQSGATNVGIEAAEGDLVLLTCADIIADERLVQIHYQAHAAALDPIAVLGRLPYAATVKMTPFMHYMDTGDVQFSYARIDDPEDVSPFFCYAPNLSTRRELLLEVGMFDEKFVYGYQDTDLGVRLAETGVRFVYRSEAVGHHDHPTDVRTFVRRQYRVGEATLSWLEKYNKKADLSKMRLLMATYYAHIPHLESYLIEAERLERVLQARPALFSAFKQKLFEQYTLISSTAVVAGMAQSLERLHNVLGTQHTLDRTADMVL